MLMIGFKPPFPDYHLKHCLQESEGNQAEHDSNQCIQACHRNSERGGQLFGKAGIINDLSGVIGDDQADGSAQQLYRNV